MNKNVNFSYFPVSFFVGAAEQDFARLSQVLALQLSSPGVLPSIQPFHSLVYPFSLAELQQLAVRYAAKAKANVAIVETHYTFRPKPKSVRLKVGYVSSDFGNHPLSHLLQSGKLIIVLVHFCVKYLSFSYLLGSLFLP